MRLPILFATALLAACATQGPEKISWAEAMKSARATPQVEVKSDPAFGAALQRFIDGAQASRRASGMGAPMPDAQAQAWAQLLGNVETFLSRAPQQTAAVDVARARIVIEGELELDAQTYGDISPETAAAARSATQRLSARLSQLLVHRPRVDPHKFAWPVVPVQVSSPFGERVHPLTGDWRTHRGVDVVAEIGQPVKAAWAGTVVFSGWNGAHGKQVQLVHDGHWATGYSHLSVWMVHSGQAVAKGEIIGFAGSTGQSTGPHLHFELLRDGEPVDPEQQLPAPPVGLPVAAR